MTIYEKITEDIKTYFKSQKKVECGILKLLKNDIDQRKNVLKPVKEFDTSDEAVKEDIFSYIKNIKNNIEILEKRGQTDEVQKLKIELKTLEQYVPSMLSKEEIQKEVDDYFGDTVPSSKEANEYRGVINKKYPKRINNKVLGEILKNKSGE